jgi:hypothetical protein
LLSVREITNLAPFNRSQDLIVSDIDSDLNYTKNRNSMHSRMCFPTAPAVGAASVDDSEKFADTV